MAFTVDIHSPFLSGWRGEMGGPNHGGHRPPNWYVQYGMDLGVVTGTEVFATFPGHVTRFRPHTPSEDTSHVYGAQLFMRFDNDMMGGFYTHITGSTFRVGQQINRGDRLGVTLRDHLHFALVEIIGGVQNGGRYMGVDIFRHFVAMVSQPRRTDIPRALSVTFKQDGSPPDVISS